MPRRSPVAPALAIAGLIGTMGSATIAQSSDPRFTNPTRFMAEDGETLYRDVCQACHMAGGTGAIGAGAYPALARNDKLESGGYAALMVLDGRKAMPGFRAMLSDDQIAAVVGYIRTHFGNDYKDAVTADDVKAARQ